MEKYILDSEGNPIQEDQVLAWGAWFENAERHVGLETINGVKVSTVFLGIDHGWNGGPPVLWETMTFTKRKGSYKFLEQNLFRRYTTAEEARLSHDYICECINRKAFTTLKRSI